MIFYIGKKRFDDGKVNFFQYIFSLLEIKLSNRKMKTTFTIGSIALLLLVLGCVSESGETNKPSPAVSKPLNPNGDSELALLMREMFEDGERMKQDILDGKVPKIGVDYEAVLTAAATEPEKAASDAYHAFALTYIETMKAIEKADPEEAATLYVSMVKTCMDCHTQLCPGPKRRIRKLEM